MDARSLVASLTVLASCACAPASRTPEHDRTSTAVATAGDSREHAPDGRMTIPAEVDEVSTDIDRSAVVCRKEVPTGTRLEQTVCRTRAEIADHW